MKFITGETLDPWQESVLAYEGHQALRCGRQTGKSEIISEKAVKIATEKEKISILVISSSQRQSSLLFEKIKGKIDILHKAKINEYFKDKTPTHKELKEAEWKIGLFKEMPTQTRIMLNNGSIIRCLPTGKTGVFIRGFSIDFLICDEAAFIPEPVWNAIMPMIAVSQKTRGYGWLILISTPWGKGGFFWECCNNPDFKQTHITSEECPRISKDFLKKERSRMSRQEYEQEYLAKFVDDFQQLFPTQLIKECMTFIEEKKPEIGKNYYLGVDVARFGNDENAFIFGEIGKDNKMTIMKVETTERKSITETAGRILKYNREWKFRRILIDDAGVGGGLFDILSDNNETKHKIRGIHNAKKSENKKVMKEEIYSNALVLMEQKKIDIIDDLDLLRSLKSITFEYSAEGKLHIGGNYTHLAEAFVRCCWAIRDKGLRLFCA